MPQRLLGDEMNTQEADELMPPPNPAFAANSVVLPVYVLYVEIQHKTSFAKRLHFFKNKQYSFENH